MPRSRADARHIVDLYDAEIRSADEAFGRLRRLLRRAGLYDDTLLILTGDHGEELGEHGKYGWHSHAIHDEILRVPLLIKFPRSWKGGTRVRRQVSHVDFPPTVFDVLGITPRWRFDGHSLVPVVASDGAAAAAEFVVSQCDDGKKPLTSIRTPHWKLLMREGSEERTLFDLEHDPGEHDDVAAANPQVVDEYEAVYRRMREERKKIVFQVPLPVSEEAVAALRRLGYRR
jgi:arylsulfatase A-like enzyme